jgi:Lar family restriction alleviation protein
MTADLKNCPFCGAEAGHDFTFAGPTEVTVYYVKCLNCECATRYHATESGAAETWNRRADTMESARQQATNNARDEICAGCLMDGCNKRESSRCKTCRRLYEDNFQRKNSPVAVALV